MGVGGEAGCCSSSSSAPATDTHFLSITQTPAGLDPTHLATLPPQKSLVTFLDVHSDPRHLSPSPQTHEPVRTNAPLFYRSCTQTPPALALRLPPAPLCRVKPDSHKHHPFCPSPYLLLPTHASFWVPGAMHHRAFSANNFISWTCKIPGVKSVR